MTGRIPYHEALDQAVRRLERRRLITREPVSGAAAISSDGIETLGDLLVLWVAQTAGDDHPDPIRLAHAAGELLRAALVAAFGHLADEVDDTTAARAHDDATRMLTELAHRWGGDGVADDAAR